MYVLQLANLSLPNLYKLTLLIEINEAPMCISIITCFCLITTVTHIGCLQLLETLNILNSSPLSWTFSSTK